MDFANPASVNVVEAIQTWLSEATTAARTPNPNAIYLATVGADGFPQLRTVLLKQLDAEHGAVFYTNKTSRKGQALAANPRAALLLHWDHEARQVRIEGSVKELSDDAVTAFFRARPRAAQIDMFVSMQSQAMASRDDLEQRVKEAEARFEGQDVPRPPHWGGYSVSLDRVELWQGRESRLHDRVVYTRRGDGSYEVERQYP